MKLSVMCLLVLDACGSGSGGNSLLDAPPDMTPEPGPSVTIRLDPPGGTPLVAFQDGDGAWQTAPGGGGSYSVHLDNNRYAVVVACPTASAIGKIPFVNQYYRTLDDGTTLEAPGCTITDDHVNVTVNVSGQMGATDSVLAWVGSALGVTTGFGPAVAHAARGKADVLLSDVFLGTQYFYRGPTLDVDGDQTITVDLSTHRQAPEIHAVTVANLATDAQISTSSDYASPYSHGLWPVTSGMSTADNGIYQTVPASERVVGDVTNVQVSQLGVDDSGNKTSRDVQAVVADPIDLSVELPDAWPVAAPTIIDAVTAQTRITLPITPTILGNVDYTISFRSVFYSSLIQIHATSGWVGANAGTSSTIITPDLSHLSGWLPEMGIHPGSPLDWFIRRDDQNMPSTTPPVDGRRILSNSLTGSLTPP